MTGRKKRRATVLYKDLSAQERVRMIFEAGLNGKQGALEPEIRDSMPYSQGREFNRLIGAVNAIYHVAGVLATDLLRRCEIMELRLVIVWLHVRWGFDRERIPAADREDEMPVPGNPVNVVPGFSRLGMSQTDKLSSLDRATQVNIKFLETELPDCWADRLALEQIYDGLRAEIGALDIDQPELREMLDEVHTILLRVCDFFEPFVGKEPELPDTPGEERVELFKEAVRVSRLPYS